MSDFVGFINGNISRELKHCTDWKGRLWGKRFHHGLFADDTSALEFLRYMLRHGVKEGLVASPEEWRGASSLPWMLHGETIKGEWVDRTALNKAMKRAKARGETVCESEHTHSVDVRLSPMPFWEDLPEDEWRAEVREMVDDIAADAAVAAEASERREDVGACEAPEVVGWEQVLREDPRRWRPKPEEKKQAEETEERNPGFIVHGDCPVKCLAMLDELKAIEQAWEEAKAAERAGESDVRYPEGTWRPARGWVRPEVVPEAAESAA